MRVAFQFLPLGRQARHHRDTREREIMKTSRNNFLFTSESVTEGHPDKIADQISDGVLDAIIAQDPQARVAVETLVKTGLAVVAGEVTTSCYVDVPKVVRGTICKIGYTDSSMGYDG